ncbi:unnamed protein product [Jaminaea pallidilutea]
MSIWFTTQFLGVLPFPAINRSHRLYPCISPCSVAYALYITMASGYGFKGGPSRCFSFWQEFQKCYAQAEGPSDCVAQSDDYLECLHHGKEIARTREVKEHFIRQELHKIKEQREKGELRATGGIMRLGLIGGDQEGGGGSGSGDSGGGGSGEKTSSGGKAKLDSSGGDSE